MFNLPETIVFLIASFTMGCCFGIYLKDNDWKNVIEQRSKDKNAECVRNKWYTFKEE